MKRPQLRDYFIEFPEHDVAKEAYHDAMEDFADWCEQCTEQHNSLIGEYDDIIMRLERRLSLTEHKDVC